MLMSELNKYGELEESSEACSKCQAEIQNDWVACPKCGQTLKKKCNGCGKLLQADWVVCPYCGCKNQEKSTGLSIYVDQRPPPGAMLNGFVSFPSGAKAHWFLDEMGRLGLEPEAGLEKPTQKDMQEFRSELARMLRQSTGE